MYDTSDKEITKNLEKKARIINLKGGGINANNLPSFVWYLKPDSSHGERFMVKLDSINWKSPSSKDLSLRYKLESAKQFLRKATTNFIYKWSPQPVNYSEKMNSGKQDKLVKNFCPIFLRCNSMRPTPPPTPYMRMTRMCRSSCE